MGDLRSAVVEQTDGDESVRLLTKYYSGAYTGAMFDTSDDLADTTPNRFTARDIAAVALLSVELPGRSVKGLLERNDAFTEHLERIPVDLHLHEADDEGLAPLFDLQGALDDVPGIGHVRRSKLLAHKRPHLVPIRDRHVLTALTGRDYGDFTKPLRDVLRDDTSIRERLEELRQESGAPPSLSLLRVLDVVVWMRAHGDAQVT